MKVQARSLEAVHTHTHTIYLVNKEVKNKSSKNIKKIAKNLKIF